jgi:hypothetical protein
VRPKRCPRPPPVVCPAVRGLPHRWLWSRRTVGNNQPGESDRVRNPKPRGLAVRDFRELIRIRPPPGRNFHTRLSVEDPSQKGSGQ